MATKVTDLIPQRSWISKWFNSSGGNREVSNYGENNEQEMDEETLQPPTKRPRIRMDMTHPAGTFNIQPRNRALNDNHKSSSKPNLFNDEMLEDIVQPSTVLGSSSSRSFVASTPTNNNEVRNPLISRTNNDASIQQQQNHGATNGTDDNSESSESTSGCSSLIPQMNRRELISTYSNSPFGNKKSLTNDKLTFTNHLQSPRSLIIDGRDTMNSRKPNFNASVMSNDTSLTDRNMALSSPFYNGNTTFGGANSINNFHLNRRHSTSANDFQLKVPRRASIRVKPSNAPTNVTDSSGISQTAKRILEALEQFSSPLTDAKKIPIENSKNILSIGQKRSREERGGSVFRVGLRHLTRELSIPTVPDMLRLKRRQKLQDTTLAARKIVSAHNDPPPVFSAASTCGTTTGPYYLREDDDSSKFCGKLRAKSKKKFNMEETVETVNFTGIKLPITNLPSFDIRLPISNGNSNIDSNELSKSKSPAKHQENYEFSSPIKFTETSTNLKPVNNFTFSAPINPNHIENNVKHTSFINNTVKSTISSPSVGQPTVNFVWSGSSTAPRPKEKGAQLKNEEKSGDTKVATELKFGSVMDILGKKCNNNEKNIWECTECYIKNNAEIEQCAACKAPKPDATKNNTLNNVNSLSSGNDTQLSTQFKITNDKGDQKLCFPADFWECPKCLLKNLPDVILCPCCNASKPKLMKGDLKQSIEMKNNTIENKISTKQNTWECPTCMVKNISTASVCVCCTTPCPKEKPCSLPKSSSTSTTTTTSSPSLPSSSSLLHESTNVENTSKTPFGFGDKFKKPEGAWSCNICMVQNKADAIECIACGETKPGIKNESKTKLSETSGSQFNFAASSNASKSQFKFGIPNNDESKSTTKTNGFTFNIPTTQKTSQPFTFGISDTDKPEQPKVTIRLPNNKESNVDQLKSNPVAICVEKQTDPGTTMTGFTFGIPKTDVDKSTAITDTTTKNTSFIFGASTLSSDSNKTSETVANNMKNDQNSICQQEKTKPTSTLFSFVAPASAGIASKDNANTLSTATAASPGIAQTPFTFSVPKSSSPENFPIVNPEKVSTSISNETTTSSGFSFTNPKFTGNTPSDIHKDENKTSFGDTSQLPSMFGNPLAITPSGSTAEMKTQVMPQFTSPNNEERKTVVFGMKDETLTFGAVKSKTFGDLTTCKPSSDITPTFSSNENPMFSIPTSAFGAPPATSTGPTPTLPQFNPSSSDKPAIFGSVTPNIFSSVKPTDNLNQGSTQRLFSFGAAPTQQTSQTPSEAFNFTSGHGATNSTSSKSIFNFGSNAPAICQQSGSTIPSFGTPNFGLSTSNNPPLVPQFSFNAPKLDALTAFGQTSSTPMSNIFGSSHNTPSLAQSTPATSFTPSTAGTSSGFNFGAPTAATGSATSGTALTGFNFSPASTPTTLSSGFNFNSVNSSPAIAFDPNTRPTFNFTGGSAPTMFNATPQSASNRKIKKAVRRIPPRT